MCFKKYLKYVGGIEYYYILLWIFVALLVTWLHVATNHSLKRVKLMCQPSNLNLWKKSKSNFTKNNKWNIQQRWAAPNKSQKIIAIKGDSKKSIMDSATVAVDLNDGDALLAVDISDALSEVDKVKFTVHTRSSMPRFASTEFSVIRLHEEFVWLHDTFSDNPEYGGYIIPPPPPR